MSTPAASAAELRRLGGTVSTLKMVENGRTDEVKESAALVLANCTQHDDKVCVELASMPTDDLKAFLAHLKSTNPIIQLSVARAVANCTSCEDDDVDVVEAFVKAGAVDPLVDALTVKKLALIRNATAALENLSCDSDAARLALVKGSGIDALVHVVARDEYPTDDGVVLSVASCLSALSDGNKQAGSVLADNGGMRVMYNIVKPLGDAAVTPMDKEEDEPVEGAEARAAAREPTELEEVAFDVLSHCIEASPAAVYSFYKLDPRFELLRNLLSCTSEDLQVLSMRALARCVDVATSDDDTLGVSPMADITSKGDSGSGSGGGASSGGASETKKSGLGFKGLSFKESLSVDPASGESVHMPHGSPREQVLSAVFQHTGVTTTWMLDHTSDSVSKDAQSILQQFRKISGDRSGETPTAQALTPLLASGIVPVLQTLLGSENDVTGAFCSEFLAWLRRSCTAEVVEGLNRVLGTDSDLELRTSIAVALVYLCLETPHIQSAFITDDGLGCVLRMLGYPSKRNAAVNFLLAVQPVFDAGDEEDEEEDDEAFVAPAGPWSEDHVNDEKDSDLTLLMGEKKEPLYVHKTVLRDHSDVVAGMRMSQRDNIEVPDADFATAEIVMKGIYSGDFDAVWNRAPESAASFTVKVLHLTNQLGAQRLQKAASVRLLDLMSEHSVVPIFKEALACADMELCNAAVEFVVNNAGWLFERGDKVEAIVDCLKQLIGGTLES